jgi:hypothetical protein
MQAPPAPSQHVLTPRPDPTPDSWYITRRDAIIEGDPGVLPSGDTCAEQRTEYADIAVAESTPPAATLASIAPATGTVGQADFTLQAIGTDFASGDQIVINSVPSVTTFVSATELSTPIVGSTLIAGSFPVLVRRGSVDTTPVNFTVT